MPHSSPVTRGRGGVRNVGLIAAAPAACGVT